jgi:hypothetical protein
MRDERLEVSVTFDERRGYVATAPELRQPVLALSLGGLRRRVEACDREASHINRMAPSGARAHLRGVELTARGCCSPILRFTRSYGCQPSSAVRTSRCWPGRHSSLRWRRRWRACRYQAPWTGLARGDRRTAA